MNLAQYAISTGIRPVELQRKLESIGTKLDHETIRRWLKGNLEPGPKHMLAIEAVTGGKVTRYHQRPDVFGKRPVRASA